MDNLALNLLPLSLVDDGGGKPLTPEQKAKWNGFIDFVEKKGYKGNPLLDDKNKALGANLMREYRKLDPTFDLSYDHVKQVQQELQDYRNNLVNDWKAKKAVIPGVKNENEIMGGLSDVDGWLGSKTTSHKFPVAMLTVTKPGATTTKNFGTDISAYDAALYGSKKKN